MSRAVERLGPRAALSVLPVIGLLFTAPAAAQQGLVGGQGDAPVAQEGETLELRGVVRDARSGRVVRAAFVRPAGSDEGSLTEEAGRFFLKLPGDAGVGEVTLLVEALGYEPLEWTGELPAADGLVLDLVPRPAVLEGLEIIVDRFEQRRRSTAAQSFVFDELDLARSAQPSLLDHLRTRLGIQVVPCSSRSSASPVSRARAVRSASTDGGPGCVRRFGSTQEVTVFIDEFEAIGGLRWLEAMGPEDLYMVEVFDRGAHIRAYTRRYMERAAELRLFPVTILD